MSSIDIYLNGIVRRHALYLLVMLCLQAANSLAADAGARFYDIPPGPLSTVLNRFAQLSGVSVSMDANIARNRESAGLQGNYAVETGLDKLLENTGYNIRRSGSGYVIVGTGKPSVSAFAPDAIRLAAIQVRASQGEGNGIYESANSVAIVTREDMDKAGPRHASEILQATPGVATVTNEQNPAVAVQIRGLKDFGRVNMNIDGMRQNYQRSGHQQRNGEMYFDTEFLSSVEISKGPSSGVGGAGAIGGVATFRTLEADDVLVGDKAYGGRIRLNTGISPWDNGQEPSGSLTLAAKPINNTDVLVAYSQKNSGEYEPGKNGSALVQQKPANYETPANIVNGTSQDMESILLKAGWDINDQQRLKFTFIGTDASYKESAEQDSNQAWEAWMCSQEAYVALGYCDDFVYDPDNVYPISSTNQVNNQNYALDYEYKSSNPYIDLAVKNYVVTTKNDYESISQNVHSKTQTDTFGGFIKNNAYFELGEKTELGWLLGIEAFQDKTSPATGSTTLTGDQIASANGVTPEGNRRIISVFTSATLYYSDWLETTPGLRYDEYRLWGITSYNIAGMQQNLIDVDHSEGKLLPTLGIAIKPWQSLQLFANLGLGWRPPAITETLISGASPGHSIAVTSYPNWTLKPEETTSWEAGFNLNLDGIITSNDSLKIKLAHFNSETENYIFLANMIGTPGQSNPGLFQNMFANSLEIVIFEGEELSFDYDAHYWYSILQITRMERNGKLLAPWFPAGGGPPEGTLGPANPDRSLYYPLPPEYTGALTLGTRLFARKLDLGMQWRYTDQSGNAQAGEMGTGININSSEVLDVYGDWKIHQNFSAGFNVKNVLDRQYIMAQGDAIVRTYAPGRTLTMNVQWVF